MGAKWAADYYDDKKNLKLFIQIFNFLDCSNQTCTTSVTNKILAPQDFGLGGHGVVAGSRRGS